MRRRTKMARARKLNVESSQYQSSRRDWVEEAKREAKEVVSLIQ